MVFCVEVLSLSPVILLSIPCKIGWSQRTQALAAQGAKSPNLVTPGGGLQWIMIDENRLGKA